MQRLISAIALFLLCNCLLFAQNADPLFLDNEDGKPLSGVVVTFYKADSLRAGFGFTDKSGRLELKPEYAGAAYFVARKMGYAELQAKAPHKGRTYLMTPKETVLPEVKVTRKPIRMQGDTVVYEASAFIKEKDAVLGDFLARLPGIKVENSGEIKYQGEPIKKLYIEGLDLLGSRYNVATKNLSSDAVSRVEVMERHQDIKMLQGKVPEKKASLNVRLKEKYKSRPFGYVEAGLDHRLEAFAGHLNLVQVAGKSVQYFSDLKGNSAGELYSDESTEVVVTSPGDFSDVRKVQSLRPMGLEGMLPIPEKEYIRNRSGLLSGNALIKTGDDRTFRINLTGFGEKSRLSSSHSELFALHSDPIRIQEETTSGASVRFLSPTLTWNENRSGVYLDDKLLYEAKWQDLGNEIERRDAKGELTEIASEPHEQSHVLKNTLQTIIPVGKMTLTLNSLLRGLRQESRLVPFSETEGFQPQILKKDELLSRQSLSFDLHPSSKLRLSNKIDYFFTAGRFSTDDRSVTSVRHFVSYEPGLSWRLVDETLSLGFVLPLSYTHHTLTVEAEQSLRLFAVSPSLDFDWRVDGRNRVRAGLIYKTEENEGIDYFPGKLYLTHRNAVSNPMTLSTERGWSGFMGWEFRDMYYFVFSNLSLMYSSGSGGLTSSVTVTPEETSAGYVSTATPTNNLMLMGDVSKTFTDLGLDLKSGLGLHRISRHYLLNGTDQNNRMTASHVSLSVSWSPLDNLTLENSTGYSLSVLRTSAPGLGVLSSHSVTESFTISYSPVAPLSLRGFYDLTAFPKSEVYKPAHLLSAEAVYKIGKDWQVSLSGRNLLGLDSFREQNIGQISETVTLTPVLPFRVMLSVKWSFR